MQFQLISTHSTILSPNFHSLIPSSFLSLISSMASVSTLPKDTTATTTTTVDDSSNPTPTLSDANATTILSLSTETKAAETETETTSTAVIIVSPARRAAATPTCIGRSNAGVSWGYSLEKGRRSTMEDAVAVHSGFIRVCCKDAGGCTAPECKYSLEMSPVHFFGLFDGHGGDQVSNYCANELCKIVAEEWEKGSSLDGWSKRWEIALCKAYERADNAFKDEVLAPKSVGTTALVLIVSPCQIIAANCGDSRAVLCRGTQTIPLTVDHKPDREDELERITSSGGRILNWGCLRVEGILSMSRAIGDHDLKPWVISVPEVTFMTRTDEDECLILASDGLWDVLSNEEVVRLARKELRQQRRLVGVNDDGQYPPACYVSQHLLKQALAAYSDDNISIIVVDLKLPRTRRPRQL